MGVITRVEIDGKTKRRESVRLVWAFGRITTLRLMFWCIMICWVRDPLPLLLYAKRGRVLHERSESVITYSIWTLSLLAYFT
jgi:hypothetical protein